MDIFFLNQISSMIYFVIPDFETMMPGWPRVCGNQNIPDPLEGYELVNRKSGDDLEMKGQILTPQG